jgi:hypothetical protein
MRIISFTREALNITIHNRYPDLELISPVYFSNSICHVSPHHQTDTSNTIEVRFGIDDKQEDFEGALLYKLQRKYANRIDDHANSSAKSIEDATKNMYLLVVWDVKFYHHGFCVCLIECADGFTWNEDKLWALCDRYDHRFHEYDESNTITWLMHDGVVMKTRLDITYESDYQLDVVLSEGIWEHGMEGSIQIDPKRLVSS